jgi:hypothetical protein
MKFDFQKYFNIKIMFNGLNLRFGFLNSSYECEAHGILYFMMRQYILLYMPAYHYTLHRN